MNKLFAHKNGFAYVITVSILSLLLIAIFFSSNTFSYSDNQQVTLSRAITMNDFINDFNKDVSRASYIAAFRSLLAIEDHIATTGEFINNTEELFQELFYYGTLNASNITILANSSLEDYLLRVNVLASDIALQTNINVTRIELSQHDPWYIQVEVIAQVDIIDDLDIASFHFNKSYITEVPIIDLRDPLYSAFTDNRIPNTIRQSPFSTLVNSTNNDTTNMHLFLNESYYVHSLHAPSFLMRFENNNSASPYGIESVVDLVSLTRQDIPVHPERVKVDYMYFNNLPSDTACDFDGIDASYHLILPTNRLSIYDLEELSYSTIC